MLRSHHWCVTFLLGCCGVQAFHVRPHFYRSSPLLPWRCINPSMSSTPQEIVKIIMDAFRPADDDDVWQFSNTIEESAGAAYHGCRVLLSYSAKADDKLDEFGRLQPGAFARAALLEKYLLEHENYRTLALLSEWKPLAPPEDLNGGLSAEQRLLVRQELGNWEQTYMKLEQLDGKWAITSIFKHDYDPAVVFKGSVRAGDDNPENPEDSREC